MQLVVLAAVKSLALGVFASPGVLRALTEHLLFHRRCDAGGKEVVHDIAVKVEDAWLFFKPVASKEGEPPCTLRIVEVGLLADFEGDGTSSGIAHGCGLS